MIWGQAGTGKSFVLNAARACYEAAGYSVMGVAPTNVVAADLRTAGFARTATIHSELYALARGRRTWNASTVVMIDEAAMIDTVLMSQLIHRAQRVGAKLILAGDDRQFASIGRGGLFSVLKQRYGAATLTEVRRQRPTMIAAPRNSWPRANSRRRSISMRGRWISWNDSQAEARENLIAAWAEDRAVSRCHAARARLHQRRGGETKRGPACGVQAPWRARAGPAILRRMAGWPLRAATASSSPAPSNRSASSTDLQGAYEHCRHRHLDSPRRRGHVALRCHGFHQV